MARGRVGVVGDGPGGSLAAELLERGFDARFHPGSDDRRELLGFLDGLDVVVSAGAPSMPLVATSVEAGVTYVDDADDPAFVGDVLRAFRQSPTTVVSGCGLPTVLGDIAAAVAAEHLGGSCRSVEVHHDGLLSPAGGAVVRTVRFPHGVREVVEVPSAASVLVPRHVRSASVVTTVARPSLADRLRRRTRFTTMVVATADDGERAVVAVVGEGDVAARVLVTAARAVAGQGAMGPAEALEPEAFLDAVRGRDGRGELEWAFAFPEGSLAPE